MKWLGIALVIYIFVNGFMNEIRGRIGSYNTDNDYYDDYNDEYEENYYNNENDILSIFRLILYLLFCYRQYLNRINQKLMLV